MADEDVADVFAIPDFWKSSTWLDSNTTNNDGAGHFSLRISSPELRPHGNPENVLELSHEGFFKLPPILDHLHKHPVVLGGDDHAKQEAQDKSKDQEDGITDLWLIPCEAPVRKAEFKTWGLFERPGTDHTVPILITEAGPLIYDELLASAGGGSEQSGKSCEILDPGGYFACLLTLSLGRASVLFSWETATNSFCQTVPQARIPGYSCEVLNGIQSKCLDCGNATQHLRSFVRATYSNETSPSQVALAKAVDDLLHTIQSRLGVQGQKTRSVLQLQDIVEPVQSVLVYVDGLVKKVVRVQSDEEILSTLFEEVQSVDYRGETLRETACEILQLVSRPWTDFVEEWIGLVPENGILLTRHGPGRSFVRTGTRTWLDDLGLDLEEPDFFLDEEKVPDFMPEEVIHAIFETGRNLRFLRDNHPCHPLLNPSVISSCKPPKLQWQVDWDAITKVEARAYSYEMALAAAVKRGELEKTTDRTQPAEARNTIYELQFFGKSETQIEERVIASLKELNQPISEARMTGNLSSIVENRRFSSHDEKNSGSAFTPHWSILPLLSFGPIVSAQSRIVNQECTRVLFKAHKLREHIQLQRDFQMLGNGLFCCRLSNALFDPDVDTAERRAGVALSGGTMGLRLNVRENWPPASSELRLALMGILSESYQHSLGNGHSANRPCRTTNTELPGDMSFAVRDLSPEEIEKCLDPHSLAALDFLRLSYKPPPPLLAVMTPAILLKYDRIFRLLLRVLRMQFVTGQLFRDVSALSRRAAAGDGSPSDVSLRFRVEAHHFVSRVTAYFFDTGIAAPWKRFEARLDKAEVDLDRDVARARTREARVDHSPDRLRHYHEAVLDEIMRTLLLRKRQQPVMVLLEEIFTAILRFAKVIGETAVRDWDDEEEGSSRGGDIDMLYRTFRKKVEVFIAVCRAMGEKTSEHARDKGIGTEERQRHSGEDSIVQLVLTLDMSGYYTRK